MASFTDATGQYWAVVLNLYTYGQVKDILDIDLLGVLDEDESVWENSDITEAAGLSDEDKQKLSKNVPQVTLFYQLSNDINLMSKVVYVLCKDQADDLGVDNKQFMTNIGGEELYAAQAALFEAIADFSQPQTKAMLKKVLRLGAKAEKRTSKIVQDALDKIDEKELLKKLETHSSKESLEQESTQEQSLPGETSKSSKKKSKRVPGTTRPRSSKQSRRSSRAKQATSPASIQSTLTATNQK